MTGPSDHAARAPSEAQEPRCPTCGYTAADVAFHMDHHLCKGPGPQPQEDLAGHPGPKQLSAAARNAAHRCRGYFKDLTSRSALWNVGKEFDAFARSARKQALEDAANVETGVEMNETERDGACAVRDAIRALLAQEEAP